MSKEIWKDQEAYDVVFNHFNNCTCQEDKFLVRSALDHIYQVLKRNEPMKVKKKTEVLVEERLAIHTVGLCPNCSRFVKNIWNRRCPDCGQELDWSDEK